MIFGRGFNEFFRGLTISVSVIYYNKVRNKLKEGRKKMEKKYQIFISSTYTDLIQERESAVSAVLEAGHIPAGMELFKSGKTQMETIKKWIDDSDIYLLILGSRYGSIDKETGKSYTQLEYEYALEKNKPIFSLVMSEKLIDKKVLESGRKVLELDNPQKLGQFKNSVLSKIVDFFDDLKDITASVHKNINHFKHEYKEQLEGWVKGSNINEMNNLKDENLKLLRVMNILRDKISSLEHISSQKEFLSTGHHYKETVDKLISKEVCVPIGLLGVKEQTTTDLLNCFIFLKRDFIFGVWNKGGISEEDIFILRNICPDLEIMGLIKKHNGGGFSYKYDLSDDGKKLLSLIETGFSKKQGGK